jgi:CelD/BcsL family acetyltransferase involved in cellulose biosynthesis/GNAT superfamily N-acetyltransferase
MTLSLQVHHSIEPIYEPWRALWRDASAGPFLHPGWHQAYIEADSSGLKPRLICCLSGEQLIGILPLRLDRDGVLRYLTAPRSDYDDILLAPANESAAIETIGGYLMARRFDLAEVPAGSPLISALTSRGAKATPAARCPGITLSAETVRDVSSRQSVKRHEKKLARIGEVSLSPVPPADSDACLRAMIDQHVSRWLATGAESLFRDDGNVAFYGQLTRHRHFGEFGAFHVLRCGPRAAAYHLGLRNASTFIWYKPTFDLNLMTLGPGEVLMNHLIAAAFSEGAGYFDFTRGMEAFKTRFSNTLSQNTRLTHRRPFLPRALGFAKAKWRRVRRLLGSVRDRLRPSRPKPQCFFELSQVSGSPPIPEGFVHEFGEIDLVTFGAESLRNPAYVTAARMASAIERAKRGDRLLTVRRADDARVVHFSWLRIDEGGIVGDSGTLATPACARNAVIFDCWTSPDCRGRGLYSWAVSFLARQAREMGHPAWIYCFEHNTASRKGIEKAGIVSQTIVTASTD